MSSHDARRALMLALLLAAPAAVAAAACEVGPAPAPPAAASRSVTAAPAASGSPRAPFGAGLTDCSWSFFGDPRALVHGETLLTGCVTSRGRVLLVRANRVTGARSVTRLFGRL